VPKAQSRSIFRYKTEKNSQAGNRRRGAALQLKKKISKNILPPLEILTPQAIPTLRPLWEIRAWVNPIIH